jgi:voltage-gated potassium channel Kch
VDSRSARFTAYRRRRFAVLFFSILLTLVGSPLLAAVGRDLDLLEAFLALNLASAILSGVVDGRWHAIAALAALFVLTRAASIASGNPLVLSASEALWAVAGLAACGATLQFALREGVVDSERIYAALSVYLLAGLVFGVAFHVMEGILPGSLRLASAGSEAGASLQDAIYFSFVTLATLGYGDVVPATAIARSLATLEAVGAQLYLAVLIARLVSLQTRHS